MLKHSVQKLLKRGGLYNRLKASLLYDAYWSIADRGVLKKRQSEVSFYRSLLTGFQKGDIIFDIGANHGQKTDVFLRLGAKVVAVEPDLYNQNILREQFLRYRLIHKPVTIIGKAISTHASKARMWVEAPGSAKNTLSPKWVQTLRHDEARFGYCPGFDKTVTVETIPLDNLIQQYGVPFFVKIDVEGHEAEVLSGLSHPIHYISFEVNLPEFRREGFQCIEFLTRLCPDARFNFSTDSRLCLALKDWLQPRQFSEQFENCAANCIEVFCTTAK